MMFLALALLAATAAAQPAASEPKIGTMTARGSVEEMSEYFSRICLAAPNSLAAQRERIKAEKRAMTPTPSEVETYVAWPVQVSITEAEGFVQCYVATPVPADTTMASALGHVRPLVASGDNLATQETLTGDYVTWRRVVGGRPQEVRFNLAATPGGKTAIISVSARKAA